MQGLNPLVTAAASVGSNPIDRPAWMRQVRIVSSRLVSRSVELSRLRYAEQETLVDESDLVEGDLSPSHDE